MHVGVAMFATDYSMHPAKLAVALEEREFESYWFPEHSHIPLSRDSDFPKGGELPKKYYDVMDPFVVMGAAAAVTSKLKVASGICLVPQRDTIQTAKSVASIDQISSGRFLFGIGSGWNADEMENHGTVFETRNQKMREQIVAMRKIWTETKPEYHGKFVDFNPMMTWPKPVQKPHPPILLGGETKYSLRRIVEFCDGWIPRGRGFADPQAEMARLKQFADEVGREMSTLSVTLFGTRPESSYIDECRAASVDRALFTLPSEGKATVLPLVDQFAQFISG